MDQATYKVVIVGGGPAAWSAAMYLARAGMKPLVLAGDKVGGQLMLTTVIENFPGFPEGIDGSQLVLQMREQAERFGAVVQEEVVSGINGLHLITDGAEYDAKAIVIATGAEAMWLNVPGEKEYIGRGVSACAVCDAAFFRGKKTFVVGGGDAAMEDALALTRFAESVTIVHRRDNFRASKVMIDKVVTNPKVTVLWNTAVEKIVGEGKVTGITLKQTQTGEVVKHTADGIFVAIGHRPATEFLKGTLLLDDHGYVVVAGQNQGVVFPTMTTVEGIFAGGDCMDPRYRQASTAAGFGVMAALDAERWLETK